jgi:hypothetical protein
LIELLELGQILDHEKEFDAKAGRLSRRVLDHFHALEPCHGAEGQSQIENVPSLGVQQASYTVIQLYMFRGRDPTVRIGPW